MVKSLGKTREVETIFNQTIYAGGLHIAMITPNPDDAKMDTLFYHCDVLGSPRKMSTMDGSIVWSQWYFPFGEPLNDQTLNNHKFTGKELDDESGLYYFCQRYYNSNIGRFITLDPQGSASTSPYAYCMNNPLKLIDPTGQQTRDIREEVIPGWFGGTLHDVAFENWWAAQTQGIGYGSWPGTMRSWLQATGMWAVVYQAEGEHQRRRIHFELLELARITFKLIPWREELTPGTDPLTMANVKAAIEWLKDNINDVKKSLSRYKFSYEITEWNLENDPGGWVQSHLGPGWPFSDFEIIIWQYMPLPYLRWGLAHEIWEWYLIRVFNLPIDPGGPGNWATVFRIEYWMKKYGLGPP